MITFFFEKFVYVKDKVTERGTETEILCLFGSFPKHPGQGEAKTKYEDI